MSVFTKIFGTHSEREVKRIIPIVDKIEALAPEFEKLTDEQLQAKTPEFKERLANGETLDDILPEAYATVREAATRVLDMRHYRVQLSVALFYIRDVSQRCVPVKVRRWYLHCRHI